jgi:hypothetical protein
MDRSSACSCLQTEVYRMCVLITHTKVKTLDPQRSDF